MRSATRWKVGVYCIVAASVIAAVVGCARPDGDTAQRVGFTRAGTWSLPLRRSPNRGDGADAREHRRSLVCGVPRRKDTWGPPGCLFRSRLATGGGGESLPRPSVYAAPPRDYERRVPQSIWARMHVATRSSSLVCTQALKKSACIVK